MTAGAAAKLLTGMLLRYLETFYRHRFLLMMPVVMVFVLTAGWVLVQPPTYSSTVRLWVERQTLVTNPNDNPYASPAQVESAVLTELIATKYFCLKVGDRSPLAESLATPSGSNGGPLQQALGKVGLSSSHGGLRGRALNDAVYSALGAQTSVAPAGPELVTITFRGSNPELSAAVAQAIADQFIDEVVASQRVQTDAAVEFYGGQITQAQTEVQAAESKVGQYLSAHPDQARANAVPDASLAQLKRDDDAAHQHLTDVQTKLDQARVNRAGLTQPSVSGMRVLDKAEIPNRASSIRVVALQGGAVALGLSVLVLVGGVLLLTMADSTLRRPEDVEQVLDVRPVGVVPRLN